jgi:hypothetical protein
MTTINTRSSLEHAQSKLLVTNLHTAPRVPPEGLAISSPTAAAAAAAAASASAASLTAASSPHACAISDASASAHVLLSCRATTISELRWQFKETGAPHTVACPLPPSLCLSMSALACSISGSPPQHPVVSKSTGRLFEKANSPLSPPPSLHPPQHTLPIFTSFSLALLQALILKYLEEHSKCPVTGAPMAADDLIDLVSNSGR